MYTYHRSVLSVLVIWITTVLHMAPNCTFGNPVQANVDVTNGSRQQLSTIVMSRGGGGGWGDIGELLIALLQRSGTGVLYLTRI